MKSRRMRIKVDFSGVQPGSGGFRIEPGEYRAECISVVDEDSSTGNPMVVWTFQLEEGAAKGRRLKYWTSLQPQALWKLQQAVEAFGDEAPTSVETLEADMFEGRHVIVVVEDNLYDGRTTSKIASLLRADDEEEDETPTTGARKAAAKAAKDDDEDIPFEEDEEEEEEKPAPAKAKKTKPAVDIEEVKAADESELKAIVKQYGLELDWTKLKTVKAKQNAVIDALEEAGYLAEA